MANGKCRLAGDDLIEVMDLGNQYVSDFVDRDEVTTGNRAPLKLGIGPTSGLVQLFDSYPAALMYKKYWYISGVNEAMRAELRSIAESAMDYVRAKPGDAVLDIASNDGTLLSSYPADFERIGIDPSDVARRSELYKSGITLVNDFFSAEAFRSATSKKAKVVTVIAMFYDLEDPRAFLKEVREVIDDTGVFIVQLSYTPLMLEQNEFGNVCHEHLCYYTFRIVNQLFDEAGFEVFDVQVNPTNSGSFRVYAAPKGSVAKLPCPLHFLDIGRVRKKALLAYEQAEGFEKPGPYHAFLTRIEDVKKETVGWLREQADRKKKVVGYGASTKGNTLLQYYDITPELLPCIAERSQGKWGKYTVGTGIPIVSEDEMRRMKPDYLFVLPWHFIMGFLEREKELLAGGTRFVVPLPRLAVVD